MGYTVPAEAFPMTNKKRKIILHILLYANESQNYIFFFFFFLSDSYLLLIYFCNLVILKDLHPVLPLFCLAMHLILSCKCIGQTPNMLKSTSFINICSICSILFQVVQEGVNKHQTHNRYLWDANRNVSTSRRNYF